MSGKNNINVLIADDHDLIRDCLSPFIRMINQENTKIDEVGDFYQLMALDNKKFDLVLMDLRMPGMNGLDTVKQAIDKFNPCPVVIMSGFVEDIDVNEALNSGVKGFIPKNMKGEAMVHALQLILSGEIYVPPKMLITNQKNGKKNSISSQETKVINLLTEGLSNKEIARELDIKEVTVKVHLRNIYRKLGVSNRVQAVRKYTQSTTKV